jgi:ABC-type transport system involved in multi-copper enzyme maturation permease subunit
MELAFSHLVLFGAITTWLKPLWIVAVGVVIAVALLFGIWALLRWLAPNIAAIAWTTNKEAFSQPLIYVLMALGTFLLVFLPFVPFTTFGGDIKMLHDTDLTLIMLLSVGLALWTSSTSVAEEIEGRIALTLLSKPVNRRQYILGKFLGIIGPVAIMFIVLGAVFLASVSFKVSFEARENVVSEPTWQQCRDEMLMISPGLLLAFMEAVVLSAISVAISTRLSMVPNLIICACIYGLGHLMPTLVDAASRQFEIPYFIAQLLATILPALETFNIYTAIATGQAIPLSYICWSAMYCLLYTTVAMLLALLLFEDRDLA